MRQIRCTRDVLVIDTDDASSVGASAVIGHGSDLLDRALVGWERFLVTFEGVPDE
ncbi:hypothetical protein J7E99_15965 [Streptomyces sp. ISL-44]|uniref:hypothetical protein n=1 Tax=Streptomyces sp. ISL-44 TaxID=2819184 RepID=UPI001BEAD009|nr:hypothetical protein [Streptomyces sp. ISL-44]MBT2542165.1 hypothetical protein [Streptomyces sp. ISL-44]